MKQLKLAYALSSRGSTTPSPGLPDTAFMGTTPQTKLNIVHENCFLNDLNYQNGKLQPHEATLTDPYLQNGIALVLQIQPMVQSTWFLIVVLQFSN